MKKTTSKKPEPKAFPKPIVIPSHVELNFTCRFDMEEVTQRLSVQQTTALFRGISEILSAKRPK